MAVGELVRDIHDSNDFFSGAAHALYDPTEQLGTEQLGAFLVGHYGVEAGNLRPFIAADALEAGVHEQGDLVQAARPGHERSQVYLSTSTVQQQAEAQAAAMRWATSDNTGADGALAVADMLAWQAHGHQRRKSGKNAYQHPMEAAAAGLAALGELEKQGWAINPLTKKRIVVGALIHDTFEDTSRSFDLHNPLRKPAITPLLVKSSLQSVGAPFAAQAARTLRLMTRYEGGLPPEAKAWALPYSEYVRNGLEDFGFCAAKPLDIFSNRVLDPKPTPTPEAAAKWTAKCRDYDQTIETIRAQAVAKTRAEEWPAWLPAFIDTVFATEPRDMPDNVALLERRMGRPLALHAVGQTAIYAA